MIDHYYLAIVEARLQLSHSGATLKQYFPVNNPRINRKQGQVPEAGTKNFNIFYVVLASTCVHSNFTSWQGVFF